MTTPPASTATPAMSVLIAVHNGLPYLESALRSIMEQTLTDIEIIVVDDASSDDTPGVLERLAAEDNRIRIQRLDTNHRLPGALNRGLELVRAPLVARMDADDIAYPDRLAVQKAYMDAHPEVVICGTSIRRIDANGATLRKAYRARDGFQTRWLARFYMPLTHPSVVFRRDLPGGEQPRYDTQFPVTEDYDFVARLLASGDAVSLGYIGLDYRVHNNSTTHQKLRKQKDDARRIAQDIQARTLPPELCAQLAGLNDAYLGGTPVAARHIFAGLRAMLAHDVAAAPRRRAWLTRQSAQLAMMALQMSSGSRRALILGFLTSGRDFVLPLALRFAETRNLLPIRLRSDDTSALAQGKEGT